MLKFFRKNQQAFIVFILFYCFAIIITCYSLFSVKHDISGLYHFMLFAGFGKYIPVTKFAGAILVFISGMALITAGFYLVRITINYLIVQKRNQFPAFFLISISSFAFIPCMFSSAIIASLFLLLAIDRVFSSINKESPSLRYLDAGILIGVGSLFYFNLIFFLPLFVISQFTLKQFSWKEFLYPLVGGIVPFIYIFSGYYLFNRPILDDLKITYQQMFFTNTIMKFHPVFLTGILIYLGIMAIANFFAIRKYATTKIQARNIFQMIFYLFVAGLVVLLLVPSAGIELFYIISIPSSVLLSIYFSECKDSIINRIFFLILMLDPLVVNLLLAIK